jgi:hypothetical protein
VEKEIRWNNGDEEFTATVYVRRMSYLSFTKNVDDWKSDEHKVAKYLAATILDEKGEPIFNASDITGEADPERGPLDASLTAALLKAATETNPSAKNPKS